MGLPPGRKALAHAVAALYGQLNVGTLAEAAVLLAEQGWRKDPSEISRYRSGRRKPPIAFVLLLRGLAVERTDPGTAVISEGELHDLHSSAEATLCRHCGPLRKENEHLRSENGRLRRRQPHTVPSPPGTDEASNPAAPETLTPLPVPPEALDRQRRARDVAAAQQLASTAVSLREQGEIGYAVALIQDTSASLTPMESAAAIALLRDRQNDLADTAIGINGRSRADDEVMRIAVELHALGLPDDAGAILRASLARTPAQT